MPAQTLHEYPNPLKGVEVDMLCSLEDGGHRVGGVISAVLAFYVFCF